MLTVPSSASTVSTASRWSDEALSASISKAMLPAECPVSAMSAPAGAAHRVHAPRSRPGGGEIEEDEAIEDRRVAHVEGGEGALGCVDHPVGDRHLAGEQEGDRAREQ